MASIIYVGSAYQRRFVGSKKKKKGSKKKGIKQDLTVNKNRIIRILERIKSEVPVENIERFQDVLVEVDFETVSERQLRIRFHRKETTTGRMRFFEIKVLSINLKTIWKCAEMSIGS